jgi:hypothetical protein
VSDEQEEAPAEGIVLERHWEEHDAEIRRVLGEQLPDGLFAIVAAVSPSAKDHGWEYAWGYQPMNTITFCLMEAVSRPRAEIWEFDFGTSAWRPWGEREAERVGAQEAGAR